MRIVTASLATETNSFSPIPTSRQSYEQTLYFPPGKHPERGTLCTGPLWVARRRAKQEGFALIEGSCFWAEPSGPTLQASYESMRHEILDQLRAAMPVDGVLLGLHGAMVATGYDDCEGDIIARGRGGGPHHAGGAAARRAEGLHGGGARPALPSHREARARRRHYHPVQ